MQKNGQRIYEVCQDTIFGWQSILVKYEIFILLYYLFYLRRSSPSQKRKSDVTKDESVTEDTVEENEAKRQRVEDEEEEDGKPVRYEASEGKLTYRNGVLFYILVRETTKNFLSRFLKNIALNLITIHFLKNYICFVMNCLLYSFCS